MHYPTAACPPALLQVRLSPRELRTGSEDLSDAFEWWGAPLNRSTSFARADALMRSWSETLHSFILLDPSFPILTIIRCSHSLAMQSLVLVERAIQPCQGRSSSAILVLQRHLGTQSQNRIPTAFARISLAARPSLLKSNAHLTRSFRSYSSSATEAPASATSGTACATTIPRPRLSPLPYIYLKDLPYDRSSELQELLVHRQIRLRKEREEQRAKNLAQEKEKGDEPATPVLSAEDGATDLLLLVEHTPTYTNGRRNRGAQAISQTETSRLQNLGATYVESLRGGEITFHGPGQLVAYPILDLKPIKVQKQYFEGGRVS